MTHDNPRQVLTGDDRNAAPAGEASGNKENPPPMPPMVGATVNSPVIVNAPIVLPFLLDFYPQRITCPYCFADVVTAVRYEAGAMAIGLGALICCLGGFLGCCFIPCCLDCCLDCSHSCPNCKRFLGIRRRC